VERIMILENEYKAFLAERELAPSTIITEISALKRIERTEDVDLEAELKRDSLASLINRYSYSIEDERIGAPNPTKIPIEPEKLRRDVGWYRRQLARYLKFRQRSDVSFVLPAAVNDRLADDDVMDRATEDETERVFELEADLQRELRRNISQLEPGLRIIDGGREDQVDAGYIDILCRDTGNRLVVVELKAGVARAGVVAQALAYMATAVDKHGGEVRGIIIASDFEPRVRHAVRAAPNLSLKRYRYSFRFDDPV
jgi:endonuclease